MRQGQRGFGMDFCVQLAFDDPAPRGDGMDHARLVEGMGCRALRVTDPGKVEGALSQPEAMAHERRAPVVVVEVILEKVTSIAIGVEIDAVNGFEGIDCRQPEGREGPATAGLPDRGRPRGPGRGLVPAEGPGAISRARAGPMAAARRCH